MVLIFFLDFVRGPYGKGLYFSMQACQAAAFSAVNFLVKVVYLHINRASLSISFPMFSPPPWMSKRETWDRVWTSLWRTVPQLSRQTLLNSLSSSCLLLLCQQSRLSFTCSILAYLRELCMNRVILILRPYNIIKLTKEIINNYSSSQNGLRGHQDESNNCFSKIQLVGQKYREKKFS